ncbi:phage tail tape measure C-terminal domain-containing protein [Ruegeria sp.]|uniref:phage tail tape measure C-terminal domain-containing protein n=1 Tax=Ruegeria sp. TaxID=1879320 RepID=UPI003B5B3BEB
MPDDLDLAMRIRADISEAQRNLQALRGSVTQATQEVAQANQRQAATATEAARAARALAQAHDEVARESTEATRAALEEARAKDTAARAALTAARSEAQAATARNRAARSAFQLAESLERQASAQTRANAATSFSGRRMGQFGAQIQNTAFQVQDFVVQVSAGTEASRAFAQQAPQLLGGFGPAGAVLGVVAAIAVPLGAALFNLADGTEDAAEAGDRLADAVDSLRSLRDLRGDVEALVETYGSATVQARALIAAQEGLARREAGRALEDVINGFDETLDARAALARRARAQDEQTLQDLVAQARDALTIDPAALVSSITDVREAALAELRRVLDPDAVAALADEYGATIGETIEEIAAGLQVPLNDLAAVSARTAAQIESEMGAAVAAIAEEFGLTEAAAQRLVEAYGDLQRAEGVEAQAEALGRLREALEAARVAATGQSVDQAGLLDAFLRRVLDAEEATRQLAAAGDTVAPGLREAARAAADLTAELDRAATGMARLQERAEIRLARARARVDFGDDPDGLRRELERIYVREQVGPTEDQLRDSGASEAEIAAATAGLVQQARAAFDARTEADKPEEQLRDIERAGTQAGTSAARAMEQLARAQAKARDEADRLREATRFALSEYAQDAIETRDEIADAWSAGFEGLEDALTRFVTTGKASFSDLARSILADLARIAVRQNITGPLADAAGAFFGSLGASAGAPAVSPRPRLRGDVFHDGGVAGFGAALQMLQADLAPNEVLATLERGEAILTSQQARAVLGISRNRQARRDAEHILRTAASYRYHTGGVAGQEAEPRAPATAATTGAARAAAVPNVTVNIDNNGTPQRVEAADVQFDLEGMIINVSLRDISEGGPLGRAVQAVARSGGQI